MKAESDRLWKIRNAALLRLLPGLHTASSLRSNVEEEDDLPQNRFEENGQTKVS